MSKYDVRFKKTDGTKVALGCDKIETKAESDNSLQLSLYDSTMRAGRFEHVDTVYVKPYSLVVNGEPWVQEESTVVAALRIAESALAHCKPDIGYGNKHVEAPIAINREIQKMESGHDWIVVRPFLLGHRAAKDTGDLSQ